MPDAMTARLRSLAHGWRDITHLSLFTSPGSPGYAALRPLATRVEPYHLNIGTPDPPGLADRGIYVDHLYF